MKAQPRGGGGGVRKLVWPVRVTGEKCLLCEPGWGRVYSVPDRKRLGGIGGGGGRREGLE